jgi:hypothetical protein
MKKGLLILLVITATIWCSWFLITTISTGILTGVKSITVPCTPNTEVQIANEVAKGYKFSMFSGDNREFSGSLIRGGSVTTGQGKSISEACTALINNHKKFIQRKEEMMKPTHNPQSTQWRVTWINPATREQGHGDWHSDYKTVAAWRDEGNQKFPEIKHYLEAK